MQLDYCTMKIENINSKITLIVSEIQYFFKNLILEKKMELSLENNAFHRMEKFINYLGEYFDK